MNNSNHKIPKRKNFIEAFYNKISKFLARGIVRTPLTPNQITIISGLFGILGAYLLVSQSVTGLLFAALCIQIYTILDLVDGDIARMKQMCSIFGKWLDIFFDKLNDLLLILGLSLGVFFRHDDETALIFGMILMGLVFFIQFSMLSNSVIFAEMKKDKSRQPVVLDREKEIEQTSSGIKKLVQFVGRHLLLEHCTFLLIVSIFALLNKLQLGLYLLTLHAGGSMLFIVGSSIYKLKSKR